MPENTVLQRDYAKYRLDKSKEDLNDILSDKEQGAYEKLDRVFGYRNKLERPIFGYIICRLII